ncbi:MAG: hypothetical protein C4524_00840 [Candidatus Zixiibacteriota bacterium]|nr:MAG: hypothetical protein C4524_00840 [candidate division Zixibacteria bacterium]
MILRLVDVTLIVLFGFMCISKIESQKKVELPQSREIEQTPLDTLEAAAVTIDAAGHYFIQGRYLPTSRDQVELFLNRYHQRFAHTTGLRVRLRADRSAPMASVKWLAEVCDRLELERSLEVVRKED